MNTPSAQAVVETMPVVTLPQTGADVGVGVPSVSAEPETAAASPQHPPSDPQSQQQPQQPQQQPQQPQPQQPPSSLLRDWAPATVSDGSNAPPVAPAVVLNERSAEHRSSSTGSRTNYPVATFVRSLVRTSVEIRDHIYASAIPATPGGPASSAEAADGLGPLNPGHAGHVANDPLSIRSAPAPMIAALSAATLTSGRSMNQLVTVDDIRLTHLPEDMEAAAHHHPHADNLHGAASISMDEATADFNSGNNSDAHSAEFVLINGDLVEIPAANLAEPDDDDYYSRRRRRYGGYNDDDDNDNDNDNGTQRSDADALPQSCRPRTSRVRRGVKGFKKWIKKIKRKRDKNHQQQQQKQQVQQVQPTRDTSFRQAPDEPMEQQLQQRQLQQQMFDSLRRHPNSSYSEPSGPFAEQSNASLSIATPSHDSASVNISASAVAHAPIQHVMSERSIDSLNIDMMGTSALQTSASTAMPARNALSLGAASSTSALASAAAAIGAARLTSNHSPQRNKKPPPKKEPSKRKKRFSFLRDSESNRKEPPQQLPPTPPPSVQPPEITTTSPSLPQAANSVAAMPPTSFAALPEPASAAAATVAAMPSSAAVAQATTSMLAPAPPPIDITPPQNRRTLYHDGPAAFSMGATASAVPLPPAVASAPAAAAAATSSLDALYEPSSFGASATPDSYPFGLDQAQRVSSVVGEASFIGNADQLLEAGVLPETTMAAEAYIEDRMDDYDKYDKKDGYPYYRSVVPRDADYKVDKSDAPCVDAMLSRADEFANDIEQDMAPIVEPLPLKARGKSDGSTIPLSEATPDDIDVHNDVLKVVMVGAQTVDKSGLARAMRGSTKKPRKRKNLGVDVHMWTPPNKEQVQFSIWDVQGASNDAVKLDGTNFGAHPGTQSLFFSDRSLYLLVWDLAANNPKATRRTLGKSKRNYDDDDSCSSSSDEEDDDEYDDNDYMLEERNRQADRALRSDIEDRVLTWVDCIARRGSHSAILPIGLVPSGMTPHEARRRCDLMAQLLVDYTQNFTSGIPPKVLMGAETLICVSTDTNMGMDLLRETIVDIATDSSHSVFDHVGTPVPKGAVHVLEAARLLKERHKLILVDHLMVELHTILTVNEVVACLHFLSAIGELFYYGDENEDVLSRYVILSRKWLVSALSCILRNDLKRELAETRQFMNMQCLYSDQEFQENHIIQTFSSHSSSCPLLSSVDTLMLWQSMNFMRQAADSTSELQESSTTESTIFGFLERLLVQSGVFFPLEIDDPFQTNDCVYFVPSLLATADTKEMWTYKSSDSWMTTLSHSWLFRDGAPVGLMETVTVGLLHDLYEFSRTVSSRPFDQHQHHHHQQYLHDSRNSRNLNRSSTFPFAQNSLTDFVTSHDDGEPIGNIKIHQIMCWKFSIMVKISCVFPDGDSLRESFVEIFITIADQSSPYCVASDIMRPTMQRLIVSGKGQVGHHGIKLWKGGYSLVLDSIKASLANCTNVDRQVVCPECLAHAHPSGASTWSWDSVRAAATSGSSTIRCMRGHRVDANMVCGTCRPVLSELHAGAGAGHSITKKSVCDLLPSVVVVALWDADTQCFRNVGSGFVVDRKYGLVVTAGHILFNMVPGHDFGAPYFGLKNTKIAVGIIPGGCAGDENTADKTAFFRYFAEIVASDIHRVDACVLKITTRMENDVASDAQIATQSETLVDFQKEELAALKITRRYELEETVRVLGFNQGGEGLLEQGKHVNRSADFAKGYICKRFTASDDHSNSSDESSTNGGEFSPREEIVIMCPTIIGHSGGAVVSDEGKVIGILSRVDPAENHRCYLVPASEIKILISSAKRTVNAMSRSVDAVDAVAR